MILNDLLLSVRIYFTKEENRVDRVYRVTIYKVYKAFKVAGVNRPSHVVFIFHSSMGLIV